MFLAADRNSYPGGTIVAISAVLVAAAIGCLSTALVVSMATSVRSMCDEDRLYEVASPHGSRAVTVAVQNCGATTPFMTVVSVSQRTLGVFPASRELFYAKGELVGEGVLKCWWASDDELVIRVDPEVKIYRGEQPFGGLEVRFEGNPNFASALR